MTTLTQVPGFTVGHATREDTGCTVVLCPPNTVGGVDQRGGAPGTRETDLLRPTHMVQHVHAVFLTGGSAFGLAVGDGVMSYLEEHEVGYETPVARVPIVPGAVLFDLDVGDPLSRPTAQMGYLACQQATPDPVEQGSVGAGTGAKVGGMLGKQFATKGGLGSASIELSDGIIVAALVAVNASGDVIDENGQILAGVRQPPEGKRFANSLQLMQTMASGNAGQNTVIGVVATNAKLNKEETNKMASMAQNGIARAVRPAHTPFDGDTIFGLASGTHPANLTVIGAYAAEMMAQAVRNGIRHATSIDGIPTAQDLA